MRLNKLPERLDIKEDNVDALKERKLESINSMDFNDHCSQMFIKNDTWYCKIVNAISVLTASVVGEEKRKCITEIINYIEISEFFI